MKWNTKTKSIFSVSVLMFLSWLLLLGNQGFAIPSTYYANYKIQNDWNTLAWIFVNIDAYVKNWGYGSSATYSQQLDIMNRIFEYFPQNNYEYRLTYEQCKMTTAAMANNPTSDNFQRYNEQCKIPLSTIKSTIDSQYTVKVSAIANPSAWSAPLVVTFDARGSYDPSNETIPSSNYYWYYRDIDGVDKTIGIWPVVKHQFNEAGTYIVHCTVRSSNLWIFDGTKDITVTVSPKSATISIYANGKKMQRTKPSKIGIQEAQKGVVLDWSSTTPLWGREILTHEWLITNRDGFKWTKQGDWEPGFINISLPGQWEYVVTLTVNDNENNKVSESYSLAVSDPVAIVQQTPEKWNTSTTFNYSANASYSLTSRLKLYTWEIYDSDGERLDTLQGKNINKQFKKPWNYSVKLTVEDEMWLKNTDTFNVYVDSTPPTPQFNITATSKWLYPSEFVLDASPSTDIDVGNWNDKLTYEWSFSNPNAVEITSTENNNRNITALFNEKWDHLITLKVMDSYGQSTEISKYVTVQSVLRPEITANPKATIWGESINFKVQTNTPVISYIWNFGDGEPARSNETNSMNKVYEKIWVYTVKVRVTDSKEDFNEVTTNVFIWEKDKPIVGYEIIDTNNHTIAQNDECIVADENGTWSKKEPAYRINRQETFTIDTSLSVNAQGNNNLLKYYFQVKNDEFIQATNFTHKFNSVGCQYIDYTLEDTSLWTPTTHRIWFKVINALPTLSNLTLSYPQYGNEIGIGFQQNSSTNNIFAEDVDPIIVKVTADGAMDTDWTISYFKWYYYPKSNPNKLLETKITPGTIPYTFFSVPRQAWEFMFWVKMFDNDEWSKSSEDILWNGPIIMFPPDTKQPDIPIVTLKTDKINAEVWEEITFDIISKIISDRSDFEKERTIQIDFDGDGEYDLTTKNDRVKYVYTKPSPANSPYVPTASVIYRDYRWIWEGAPIVVKASVRPSLIYTAIWKSVIFKDVSLGKIIEREICLDKEQCELWNQRYFNTTLEKTFKVTYPKKWTYTVIIKAKDENGNEAESSIDVTVNDTTLLKPIANWIFLISLPEAEFDSNLPEIFVGRQLNNEVLFYIKSDESIETCYVDSDISFDSKDDWDPTNNRDFSCNRMSVQTYTPSYESAIGRIYYKTATDSKLKHKDFMVSFADFEKDLDASTKDLYNLANDLITTIDTSESITFETLRSLILTLRNDLANWDKNAQRGDLIQLDQFLLENKNKLDKLSETQKEKLDTFVNNLSEYLSYVGINGTPYEVAKEEILSLLPLKLQETINKWFTQLEELENEPWKDTPDERLKIIESINYIISNSTAQNDNIWDEQIAEDDYQNTVRPNLCKIAESLDVISTVCSEYIKKDPDKKIIDNETLTSLELEKGDNNSNSSGMPGFIKVILWILWIVVFAFIGLISAFAIKAKLREKSENEDE